MGPYAQTARRFMPSFGIKLNFCRTPLPNTTKKERKKHVFIDLHLSQ